MIHCSERGTRWCRILSSVVSQPNREQINNEQPADESINICWREMDHGWPSAVSVWRERRRPQPGSAGNGNRTPALRHQPVLVTSRSRDQEFVLVLRSAGRSAAAVLLTAAYLISSCSSSRVSSSSACLVVLPAGLADILGYLFLAAQLVLLTPVTPPFRSPRCSHFLFETTP